MGITYKSTFSGVVGVLSKSGPIKPAISFQGFSSGGTNDPSKSVIKVLETSCYLLERSFNV